MRSIPENFDKDTTSSIDTLLDRLVAEEQIAIPLAIESGSRAWGFPSPDSDYDCRFVYVRKLDGYLTPWTPPDVIETPLVGDLDVNGWDLGKALKLMLNGNAVILEWLQSPIVYRGNAEFRGAFLALAARHANRQAIARHYLHLGERQRNTYFRDGKSVAIKKLFYALRPAAALRWMRLSESRMLPPMHFPTLLSECDPPAGLAALIGDLLSRKAVTREMGASALPAPIRDFVDQEFLVAHNEFASHRGRASVIAKEETAAFFREWVKRLG